MNRTMKIVKYQLHDSLRALGVYYIIIVLIGVFMATISINSNGNVANFNGISLSSGVFLFSISLGNFRSNFLFMQANNLPRNQFFVSSGITWTFMAGLMAVLEVILNQILRVMLPYKGIFEQLYARDTLLEDFMWNFAAYVFIISTGWIIALIYYRSNKIMKVVVSLSPVFLIIVLSIIDNMLGGDVIGKAIEDFFNSVMGFSGQYSIARAVVSLWVMAASLYGLSYLLVRRAPIK